MEKAAGDKLGVLSAVFCCFLHGAPYSAGKSGGDVWSIHSDFPAACLMTENGFLSAVLLHQLLGSCLRNI